MTTAPLDFYFDYSSPAGYVASTRIDAIAAAYGRDVNWRPVLLGPIFKVTGSAPLLSVPLKGKYAKHDFMRTARLNGVEMRFPSTFPFSSVAAARAHYWLSDHDKRAAVRFTQAVLHAVWVEDRDISTVSTVLGIAGGLGHDEIELEAALSSQPVKDRLKNEVDEAMARGVFGSPYVIVDGEPFWGADRLGQIEKWLQTGGW